MKSGAYRPYRITSIVFVIGLGVVLFLFKATPAPPPDPVLECRADTLGALMECLNSEKKWPTIRLTQDIQCVDCCGLGVDATIPIKDRSNLKIVGDGHYLTRTENQKICPALAIVNCNGVSVENLSIDEKEPISPCTDKETCRSSLFIQNSTNIQLSKLSVFYAKSSAFLARNVTNLKIEESIFSSSGLLGFQGKNILNFNLRKSIIAKNRMQGLFLEQGLNSEIKNNIFVDNLYQSQIKNAAGDGISSAQILLQQVRNLLLQQNLITDGACLSCENPFVPGVELSDDNADVKIHDNDFINGSGPALKLDKDAYLRNQSSVWHNRFIGISDSRLLLPQQLLSGNSFSLGEPSLDRVGVSSYTLFRLLKKDDTEILGNSPNEAPDVKLKAAFGFSSAPRAHADPRPLYRCHSKNEDRVSRDPFCDQQKIKYHSLIGFNFEPQYIGAKEFFMCLNKATGKHFASWDPLCEGQTLEKSMGYAVDRL